MRKFMNLAVAGALALGLAACNTPGDRAVGGAAIGGLAGAGIGGLAGGGRGALIGGLAGAATGAVVGAATTPERRYGYGYGRRPVDGPIVYEEYRDYGFDRYHGSRPTIYREYARPLTGPESYAGVRPYYRHGAEYATPYDVPPPRVYAAPY